VLSTQLISIMCCRTSQRGPVRSSTCFKGSATVLQAEALEEQLVKSRKHAAVMQSKLDTAFAKYHNNIQDMQAKSDELVRKNKSLRNKNKGTRPPCRVLVDSSLW
jgi:Skp family chaperone for outer membrane proteins